MRFLLRFRERGGHVRVQVFGAPSLDGTYADHGTLVFRADDWHGLVRDLADAPQTFDVQLEDADRPAPTYTITRAGAAIRCDLCGAESVNPTDVAQRYCGRCHLFHDAVAEARRLIAQGGTHDCGDWRTGRGGCALCGFDLP